GGEAIQQTVELGGGDHRNTSPSPCGRGQDFRAKREKLGGGGWRREKNVREAVFPPPPPKRFAVSRPLPPGGGETGTADIATAPLPAVRPRRCARPRSRRPFFRTARPHGRSGWCCRCDRPANR